MTDNNLTLIAMVVDRSGSMQTVREATISAFNEFLDSQRNQPGHAQVALTLFNERVQMRHEATPIAHVDPFTVRTYVPVGLTALFDAVGATIDRVGERLAAKAEHDRPGKVIFVIQTDGMENASSEYSGQKVRDMIKHQQEHYDWVFTFLGANQDAWNNPLDIARGNTISYSNDPLSTRRAVAMASVGTSLYRSGKGGQSANVYGEDAVDLRTDEDA